MGWSADQNTGPKLNFLKTKLSLMSPHYEKEHRKTKQILPCLCLSERVDDNCFSASSGTHDHSCVTCQHGLIHLNNFVSLSRNHISKQSKFFLFSSFLLFSFLSLLIRSIVLIFTYCYIIIRSFFYYIHDPQAFSVKTYRVKIKVF